MPANFESGFFVRQPAWHGMGNVLAEYPGSWAEARKAADLLWEPVSAPQFGFKGIDATGKVVYAPGEGVVGEYFTDEGQQRIIRSDTGALLGCPTADYQLIDHTEMGEIIEALNGQPNVKYETTVVLESGKAVASVIRLDEPVTIPGDNTLTFPYLALTNRHDGHGKCRALSTSVRIVCSNTLAAAEAEGERNGTVFEFSHSKSWRERIEEAKETIKGLRVTWNRYLEFAEEFAGIRVTKEQTELFLVEFIALPPSEMISDRVVRNVEQARNVVRQILDGPTCETINGTAFGLVQAAGEYLDHYRGYQSKDTLFGRQLLTLEKRKTRAVQIARDLVRAA